MDRLVELARGMVPDKFTIARVRARGDDSGKYLLQVSGRDRDFLARADGRHAVGDDVLVLLEPNVHAPVIIDVSPWRACYQVVPSTNNGEPWTVDDINAGELEAAIESNVDVVANLANAHEREHSMLVTADHSDASGSAGDDKMMAYVGGSWTPVSLVVRLDGGTR